MARATGRIRDLHHLADAAVITVVGIRVGKIEVRRQLEPGVVEGQMQMFFF